jgi:hypothetical protein
MTSVIARHSDPVPGLLEALAELRRRGVQNLPFTLDLLLLPLFAFPIAGTPAP